MNSLRARIIALLIFAIVSVVGLATFAAIQALRPPEPGYTLAPVAQQLRMLVSVAEQDRKLALNSGMNVQAAPASGIKDIGATGFLSAAMARNGKAPPLIVSAHPDDETLTASVQLMDGAWLITRITDMRPPSGGGMILAGWITMIILGSTAISVFAAAKIIRPLEFLERSVSLVGPDGLLPTIPEAGPAEVRATARALNRLSSRLKVAIESRMRLVAAAGHDLRTPMTRMRLRAEFITDDEEKAKWLNDLEELDAIADSAIRLVQEEAKSDLSDTLDLGVLVRETVQELADLDYKVSARSLASLPVQAAPVALKRALRNLMINAATHGGGAIIALEERDAHGVLIIIDHGPGIPEDRIGQVFEPFFRVDKARRKMIRGAGLGLAIAKEIIERFDGTIRIANRREGGLVQTITFPRSPPADALPS